MSHVVRCEVLDAEMEHREEWLRDTMDFMAERWPGLTDLQLAQLEMVGKQFIRPAIPHGKGNHAKNRPEAQAAGAEVKDAGESAPGAADADTQDADVEAADAEDAEDADEAVAEDAEVVEADAGEAVEADAVDADADAEAVEDDNPEDAELQPA